MPVSVMMNAYRIKDGRQTERVRTQAEGSCTSERGFEWFIKYEDLSPGGCRVDDPRHGLVLGAMVRLDIAGTGPHHAEVAWRQGDRVGLEFVVPLTDEVFYHLKHGDWDAAKAADELPSPTRYPVRRVI